MYEQGKRRRKVGGIVVVFDTVVGMSNVLGGKLQRKIVRDY